MNRTSRNRRRGGLMICVLACMAIVASLVAWIARDAVHARRETRLRLQLMQTERLLDAGILRSARQLRKNKDYQGETWSPELSPVSQTSTAVVTIEVKEGDARVTAKIDSGQQVTSKSYVYSSSEVQ